MEIRAGSAHVDVTPERSAPLSGYGARRSPSSGKHDPLMASALVVDDGATTVAMVSVDLLNVSRSLTSAVKRRLARSGVDVDDLLLAATHTHGGPYVPTPVIDVHPKLGVDEDVSCVMATLEDGIVEAVSTAHERCEPAAVGVGTATDDGTIVNRRGNLGARLPVDDVDRDVVALLVTGDSGKETIVYSLACHPVSIGGDDTLFTADWPGVVRRNLIAERDGEPTVLFLNGAAGDVTTRPECAGLSRADDSYAYMEAAGEQITASVRAALSAAETKSSSAPGPIVSDSRKVRLPIRSVPPVDVLEGRLAEFETVRERVAADGHDDAAMRYQRDISYVEELLALAEWDARHLPGRLQYLELGSVGLLSFPAEAFVRHGLDFKKAAATDVLLPIGYASDYVGYLPTLDQFENWGYEVRTTKVSPRAVLEFRRAAFDLVARPSRGSDLR